MKSLGLFITKGMKQTSFCDVAVAVHKSKGAVIHYPGNLTRWNERVHLRVDGGGNILPVDGDGLPFLLRIRRPSVDGIRLCSSIFN